MGTAVLRELFSASRFAEGAQLRVPTGFEGVGDESVRGREVHKALASEIDFVLRALDLSMTQAISFVEATLANNLTSCMHEKAAGTKSSRAEAIGAATSDTGLRCTSTFASRSSMPRWKRSVWRAASLKLSFEQRAPCR
jgi:hypothetical protein